MYNKTFIFQSFLIDKQFILSCNINVFKARVLMLFKTILNIISDLFKRLMKR